MSYHTHTFINAHGKINGIKPTKRDITLHYITQQAIHLNIRKKSKNRNSKICI